MKKNIFIMISILFSYSLSAQDCNCPEWNGSVIPELTVNSCDYEGDNPSLKAFADWDCCQKKCKSSSSIINNTESSKNVTTRENKVDVTTNKNSTLDTQKTDTQKFIDKQKQQAANQERLNQKLANNLTQTFNQISNSWAKEKDFQSKISTLTNISSVNASSIISEARSKAQQINVEYSKKKNDALNQGVSATQTLVNSAQNEKQALVGGLLGVGLTAISQANIEKERKNAQDELENEKHYALKGLSQKIIDKFIPIKEQHKKAAILAVLKNKEDYHLANYEYAKCMIDNAYEIVVDNYSCKEPIILKPIVKSNKIYRGQDYYNAYLRKIKSNNEELNIKAFYFLELAIEKEPNNANYLYAKSLSDDLDIYEKAALLKKAHKLDLNNDKITSDYHKAIKDLKEFIEAERLSILKFVKSIKDYDWDIHSGLKKFQINNKTIFIDKNGNIVFELNKKYRLLTGVKFYINRYYLRNEFFNDILQFYIGEVDNRKYGFLNSKGEIEIPAIFENKVDFSEELAHMPVFENELTIDQIVHYNITNFKHYSTYVNKQNVVVIDGKGKFYNGDDFINGFGKVQSIEENKFYFINKFGVNIFKNTFDAVIPFYKVNYTLVKLDGKWIVINKNGEIISNYDIKNFKISQDAKPTKIWISKRKWFYLDSGGEIIDKE